MVASSTTGGAGLWATNSECGLAGGDSTGIQVASGTAHGSFHSVPFYCHWVCDRC